ncbi:2-methylthioadenine synthetase [Cenarchaeum symbiosum A]|uniref:tRNA-t(6)A37 methylthiotransferase n=1 Tax=Cenarchaeum symbiosum (strain A) TaxID=414004 RepID=A0RW56_CENSY|nr:2-methylthioadenine synthetase [Cenarchaeum symbiosum A]
MARIWIEAYGCSASQADSEMISGLLVNGGHTLAASPEESDAGVIVTCAVKDATANRMVHRIKMLGGRPLVVAGCLPKAEPGTMARISPGAALMGPNSIGRTVPVVEAALRGERRIELDDTDLTKTGLPKVRLNEAVGIVEIASGCLSECTFCQTKLAKGDLGSYRIGDIVRQVRAEVDDGCSEVWLTSTDNGCYGFDISEDLPGLLDAVITIPGRFRVRVGMMNPMYMPRIREGLAKSFQSDKLYRFLHIPVQSGSGRILGEMGRGRTAGIFADAARRFRSEFGGFTISTDVIVGFPGETDGDYESTEALIEEVRPDTVNLSRYSARPGTEAAGREQVDVQTVKRRSKRMYELSCRISLDRNKEWVGWKGDVLFSEATEGGIRGRNREYKPVYAEGAVLGETRQVRITKATNHCLVGEIES